MKKQALQHTESTKLYTGRYAPTPSGLLHIGHAATFRTAYQRAKEQGGRILLRVEDLDRERCRTDYESALIEDMQWMGLFWDPDPHSPEGYIRQSDRIERYREVLDQLVEARVVYPCTKSRKEIREHPDALKTSDGEILFPESLRSESPTGNSGDELRYDTHWRFRVDYGTQVVFGDGRIGPRSYEAGVDFGDFLVWSKSGYPAYELAVVIDDMDSEITEVVRGEDLLLSTARQILLYRALKARIPDFYHCPLVKDEQGVRLAKQYDSKSIRSYREQGFTPEQLWKMLESESGS